MEEGASSPQAGAGENPPTRSSAGGKETREAGAEVSAGAQAPDAVKGGGCTNGPVSPADRVDPEGILLRRIVRFLSRGTASKEHTFTLPSLGEVRIRYETSGGESGTAPTPTLAVEPDAAKEILARNLAVLQVLLGGRKIALQGIRDLPETVLQNLGEPRLPAPEGAEPVKTAPPPPPREGRSEPSPAPAAAGAVHRAPPAAMAEEAAGRWGTEDLHRQILDQIRGKIDPARNTARIHLSPPELGEIRIHLALQDHRLLVRMEVEQPVVRHLLARDLEQLRSTLADAGLEVDRFHIQARGEGQSPFRGRSRGGGETRGGRRESREALREISADAAPLRPAVAESAPDPGAAPGRVNYLVY